MQTPTPPPATTGGAFAALRFRALNVYALPGMDPGLSSVTYQFGEVPDPTGEAAAALVAIRTLSASAFACLGHSNLYATTIEDDPTGEAAAALVAIHNDGIPTHAGKGCGASKCLTWSPHARRVQEPDSRRVRAENAPVRQSPQESGRFQKAERGLPGGEQVAEPGARA